MPLLFTSIMDEQRTEVELHMKLLLGSELFKLQFRTSP